MSKTMTGRKEVFTKQGIQDFKRLYPVTSNSELAKKFKTTIATIEWKAEVLNLQKQDPIDIIRRKHQEFKRKYSNQQVQKSHQHH